MPATANDIREEISAKFNMTIVANNVDVGETVSTNFGVSITAGDPDSLRRYLDALGIDSIPDRDELIAAAEEARAAGTTDVEQSGRLKAAIAKVSSKLGWTAATTFIQGVITQWIGG
ncbi:MAG: hypothetical protein ACRDQW_10415 [Haloechinothrix sp.]